MATTAEPDNPVRMTILLADDDSKILSAVSRYLESQGHCVYQASDGAQALELFEQHAPDVVITDITMPRMDGFQLLGEVRRRSPRTEVIMITGFRELENAFRAMREGAADFLTKPVKVENLDASLQRTVRFQALQKEKDRVQQRLDWMGEEERLRHGIDTIIGNSSAIRKVKDLIRQVAGTDGTTVLITGDTGTGKELVAHAIHYESDRAGGPFVAVDCSAVPESLMESQFYGHVKGAFTDAKEARPGHFRRADGGTLFLDEIGDMPLPMQSKLLRTLEERRVSPVGASEEVPVDVRVVAATNRDLPEAVSEGEFRRDLYHRLNVFRIDLPPLRQRPEDIVPLAEHFLQRFAQELRRRIADFSPQARELLERYPFDGNVRELRNAVERAVILCAGDEVTPDHLADLQVSVQSDASPSEPVETEPGPTVEAYGQAVDMSRSASLDLKHLEREALREALRRADGNKAKAAELLGLTRQALLRRMDTHGL